MQHDQLIGQVQARAKLSSRGDAERAVRPQAAYQARAVLEVIDEATTGGVMDRVRDALSQDVRALALAGSTGELR